MAREIRILKHLQHDNLIGLYDAIDTSKQLYLIMDLAQGIMLNDY